MLYFGVIEIDNNILYIVFLISTKTIVNHVIILEPLK